MLQKIRIVLIIIFSIDLIIVNVFLYRLWNKTNSINLESQTNEQCPSNCNEIINTLVNEKIDKISPIVTIPTSTPTAATIKKIIPKKRSIQYIPIPGSGNTLENKWVDLAGTEFYISTDDYPNLIEAYFEANMRLINGNGLAYLRLFDITAGVEVWGSEISTNSQNFTSVSSGKLTIRNGTHLYRVQAKSLTADTTVFNSGKIKVILENN